MFKVRDKVKIICECSMCTYYKNNIFEIEQIIDSEYIFLNGGPGGSFNSRQLTRAYTTNCRKKTNENLSFKYY
jgi:hypothetical protein